MKRQQAIERIQSHTDHFRDLGVTAMYLFGSTARGTASDASDIDVFVDYEQGSAFSLFEVVTIQCALEDDLGIRVDVTTRNGLHPKLKPVIEREAHRIF